MIIKNTRGRFQGINDVEKLLLSYFPAYICVFNLCDLKQLKYVLNVLNSGTFRFVYFDNSRDKIILFLRDYRPVQQLIILVEIQVGLCLEAMDHESGAEMGQLTKCDRTKGQLQ